MSLCKRGRLPLVIWALSLRVPSSYGVLGNNRTLALIRRKLFAGPNGAQKVPKMYRDQTNSSSIAHCLQPGLFPQSNSRKQLERPNYEPLLRPSEVRRAVATARAFSADPVLTECVSCHSFGHNILYSPYSRPPFASYNHQPLATSYYERPVVHWEPIRTQSVAGTQTERTGKRRVIFSRTLCLPKALQRPQMRARRVVSANQRRPIGVPVSTSSDFGALQRLQLRQYAPAHLRNNTRQLRFDSEDLRNISIPLQKSSIGIKRTSCL